MVACFENLPRGISKTKPPKFTNKGIERICLQSSDVCIRSKFKVYRSKEEEVYSVMVNGL